MPTTEQERANMSKRRGVVAAGMDPGPKQREFVARQGEEERKGKENLQGLGEDAFRQQNLNAVKGSMKKGGMIPSTGVYKLHKGEKVIPKHMVAHGLNKNMIHTKSSANHKRYDFGKE